MTVLQALVRQALRLSSANAEASSLSAIRNIAKQLLTASRNTLELKRKRYEKESY